MKRSQFHQIDRHNYGYKDTGKEFYFDRVSDRYCDSGLDVVAGAESGRSRAKGIPCIGIRSSSAAI
jgi:hypothetical protein